VLYDIHAYKDNINFPNLKFLAILICAKSASDHLFMHDSAHLEMWYSLKHDFLLLNICIRSQAMYTLFSKNIFMFTLRLTGR
jgi:hypothetical protein